MTCVISDCYRSSIHFSDPPVVQNEWKPFGADLVFGGEADASRLHFFRPLVGRNLNLALHGGLWNRDRQLGRYFRDARTLSGGHSGGDRLEEILQVGFP